MKASWQIDAFQTEDNVVIKAPIAGVSPDDLEISITDEVVSVKGERKDEVTVSKDGYFVKNVTGEHFPDRIFCRWR